MARTKKAASKKTDAKGAAKKKAAPKASAKKKSVVKKATAADAEAKPVVEKKPKPKRGAALLAEQILAEPMTMQAKIADLGQQLIETKTTPATNAARVLHEILALEVAPLVPLVEKFARSITSKNKRVVQASADALPAIAKIQPARVAKHLDTILLSSFEDANDDGKDGLVRTFATLCAASVAYQKRLEPVLTTALQGADGKTLLRWSQKVLPALKGEPHARAREVVQARLYRIPSNYAREIAEFLGIRLRVRYH